MRSFVGAQLSSKIPLNDFMFNTFNETLVNGNAEVTMGKSHEKSISSDVDSKRARGGILLHSLIQYSECPNILVHKKTLKQHRKAKSRDNKSTRVFKCGKTTYKPIAPSKTSECCSFYSLKTEAKFHNLGENGEWKVFPHFFCVETNNLHNFPVKCLTNCKHSITWWILDTETRNMNAICRFYCYEILFCFDLVLKKLFGVGVRNTTCVRCTWFMKRVNSFFLYIHDPWLIQAMLR